MFSLRRPQWSRHGHAWDEIGSEVSVEGSICQAAQAIDIAAKLAAQRGDHKTLILASECFTKLADFIVALSEHQGDKKSDLKMGFQPSEEDEEECTK